MKKKLIITLIYVSLTSLGTIEYNVTDNILDYNFSCNTNTRYRLWNSRDLIKWNYQETIKTLTNQININIPLLIQTNSIIFYKTDITPNSPQREWFVSYNGSRENKESHGHYIIACEDGGFLQIGESGSPYDSGRILVIKINSNGDLLWKQESEFYVNGQHNLGNSAIEVADGYVIFGAQSNGNGSTQNSMIAKLNKSDGSIIFLNTINNGGSDAFEHGTQTENGFIAVGYNHAQDPNNTFFTEGNGIISFLDNTGNIINNLDITSILAQGYRIFPVSDGYIISGQTSEALQYGVIKLSKNNQILWTQEYGYTSTNGTVSDYDHCFGLAIAADESIYLCGHTQYGYQPRGNAQTNNWDTFTIKLDAQGNEIWRRRRGNPRGFDARFIHDEAWGIKATPDGGCLVVAGSGDEYSYSENNENGNSNQWVVYLVKYASDGVLEWEETYQSADDNEESNNYEGYDWAGEDVVLTSDGGALIAVDNGKFGFLKIASFLSF